MSPASQSPSRNFQMLGAVVAWGCVAMAVAMPALSIAGWGFSSAADLAQSRSLPVPVQTLAPNGNLTLQQRWIGAIGTLAPQLILAWGLFQARTALSAIAAGRFFASEVVEGLKGYALAALWSTALGFLLQPLLSVGLTFANPPGFRVLTLGVSSNEFFSVLDSGIVWVIVAALAHGAAMARENE